MLTKDRLLELAAFLGLAICVGFGVACFNGGDDRDDGGGGGGAAIPPSGPTLQSFAAAVSAGDAAGALQYVAPDMQANYQEIFTELGAAGMTIFGTMLQNAVNNAPVSEQDGEAYYEVQDTLADGQVVRSTLAMAYIDGAWWILN